MGDVDRRITELFFEKSMGQHLQESSSLNTANIEKGRSRVVTTIEMLLFQGIEVLIVFLISFVFLCILSPVAGLVMGIVIVLHLAFSLYLNKKAVEECTPIDGEYRRLNRHRVERWEKMERVKTCGKEAEELNYMTAWFDRVLARDRDFWLWFINMVQVRGLLNLVGYVVIMAYGAWLVWNGSWMIGMLYPLYAWASRVDDHIWQLSRLEHQLNWNMPSVRSMMESLTIRPDVVSEPDAPVLNHANPIRVAFENVSYAYPIGSIEEGFDEPRLPMPVIKNISFEIAPGEKVALIGPSGVGKTTVMRLLLRYMDPDKGDIHVNGFLLREINLASWMKIVGYIPQQAHVLDGTVRYNLTYGLSAEQQASVIDDELWTLMQLLQIDFGERLIDGLDTVVGRNGVKLSGGQAQRLMIGAAAMKKPLFMIIDEATSSLDSTTEKLVQDGLAKVLTGNVSALVIAHRLSSVRYLCNKFIVLRDTASLANGGSQIEAVATSFEKLYTISPTFRQLADDQGVVICQDNAVV